MQDWHEFFIYFFHFSVTCVYLGKYIHTEKIYMKQQVNSAVRVIKNKINVRQKLQCPALWFTASSGAENYDTPGTGSLSLVKFFFRLILLQITYMSIICCYKFCYRSLRYNVLDFFPADSDVAQVLWERL